MKEEKFILTCENENVVKSKFTIQLWIISLGYLLYLQFVYILHLVLISSSVRAGFLSVGLLVAVP